MFIKFYATAFYVLLIIFSNLTGASATSQEEINIDKKITHSSMPSYQESKDDSFHLLFLCTGNSCRSQMAEGWARYLAGDSIVVESAGIQEHGLNPRAVSVMQESLIDIAGQTSKRVTSEMLERANLVVTVCGDAHDNCPRLPDRIRKLHWPLLDPARLIGNEEEVIAKFREVRDEIKFHVQELLKFLREENLV